MQTPTPSAEKLPWIEKYRPKYLDDIVDHAEKIKTIRNLIRNKELPHLLFYGPPGTGKTSLIIAIAREIYGEDRYRMYIKEINASGDRGIDTVRTNISQFIRTKSDKVKLVILDEADAMTGDAQNALRVIMERSTKQCRFCLICNNISKIVSGIQSRCTKMRFGALSNDAVQIRLQQIVKLENIRISPDGITALIELEKDFRQMLNILQSMHYL